MSATPGTWKAGELARRAKHEAAHAVAVVELGGILDCVELSPAVTTWREAGMSPADIIAVELAPLRLLERAAGRGDFNGAEINRLGLRGDYTKAWKAARSAADFELGSRIARAVASQCADAIGVVAEGLLRLGSLTGDDVRLILGKSSAPPAKAASTTTAKAAAPAWSVAPTGRRATLEEIEEQNDLMLEQLIEAERRQVTGDKSPWVFPLASA